MRPYVAGLMIAAVSCFCATELTFGQANSKSHKGASTSNAKGSRNVSGFQKQFTTGSTSTSRSVSFKDNGRRVSITENGNGITVTIDGETVQARDAAELKKNSPEAYQLYKDRIGAARASASGRASGGASSSAKGQSSSSGKSSTSGSSGGGASGGGGTATNGGGFGSGGTKKIGSQSQSNPGQASKGGKTTSKSSQSGSEEQSGSSSSESRSTSVLDGDRKISITEDKSGITVTINSRKVRARNAAELKKKSPSAYKLYRKHLADRGGKTGPDANKLMRENLNKLRRENANNPQLRRLIDKMLQEVGK